MLETLIKSSQISDLCSHLRSVEYFAESVKAQSASKFIGLLCGSWRFFSNLNCLGFKYKPTNRMGIDADRNQPGKFYLQTNNKPAYSRGQRGLIYTDEAFSRQLVSPFFEN